MPKKSVGFKLPQLERKVKQIVKDVTAELKPVDRKNLANNMQAIVDKVKNSKRKAKKNRDAEEATVVLLERCIGLLRSKAPLSHTDMLVLHGHTLKNMFTRPKGIPDRMHRLLAYATMLIA